MDGSDGVCEAVSMSPCWRMPSWMERYRSLSMTDGELVEKWMNASGNDARIVGVKRQVALLIALREAGELAHSKPDR